MSENYKKYIKYLLISLILLTLGSFIGIPLPQKYFMLYGILSIVLIIIFYISTGKTKKVLFFIFCFGEGCLVSPLLSELGSNLLFLGLLTTTLITIICSFIGYKANDLSSWRIILFNCLTIGIALLIVAIFLPIPFLSILFALLFCLYIMYDVNRFKNKANSSLTNDEILDEAMMLYLDILNLFVHILDIFSN